MRQKVTLLQSLKLERKKHTTIQKNGLKGGEFTEKKNCFEHEKIIILREIEMKIVFLIITLVRVQKLDNIIQKITMRQKTGPLTHFGGNTKCYNSYGGNNSAESSSLTIPFEPGKPTLIMPQN